LGKKAIQSLKETSEGGCWGGEGPGQHLPRGIDHDGSMPVKQAAKKFKHKGGARRGERTGVVSHKEKRELASGNPGGVCVSKMQTKSPETGRGEKCVKGDHGFPMGGSPWKETVGTQGFPLKKVKTGLEQKKGLIRRKKKDPWKKLVKRTH